MKHFFFLLLANLGLTTNIYAWRIEKKILIIEKGDNLSKISHSLLGKEGKYDQIWKRCIDTLISRNPNLIHEGMRFSIDSLLIPNKEYSLSVPIILNESKSEEDSHFWDAINTITTLLSVVAAAMLADFYFNRNERRKIAFDLFSEFNASEMHQHRIKADSILAKNLYLDEQLKNASEEMKKNHQEYFRNFHELDIKQIEDKRSIYMILNFYKRLELLRLSKKVEPELIPHLFGEIFYYWWYHCFDKFSEESNWEAFRLVHSLYNWMNLKSTNLQKENWKKSNQNTLPKLTIAKKEEALKTNLEYSDKDIDKRIRAVIAQILEEYKNIDLGNSKRNES